MPTKSSKSIHLYERIYAVVRQVPYGQVATYGQIAGIVGGCAARMVGYAMSAAHWESDVPWQRIINSEGKISPRISGHGSILQRELLEEEGVRFDRHQSVDFAKFGWQGTAERVFKIGLCHQE